MLRSLARAGFVALALSLANLTSAPANSASAQSAGSITEAPPHVNAPASDMDSLFSHFYPPGATEQRIDGDILLSCRVHLDQRADCTVESERPDGWGFGQAAVALSRSLRFTPAVRRGVSVDGELTRVPVHFTTDEDNNDLSHLIPEEMRNSFGDLQPEANELFNYFASIPTSDLPRWENAPSPQRVAALTPTDADHPKVRVALACTVRDDRSLLCPDEPSRTGAYVQAALQLSRGFTVAQSSDAFIAAHRTVPFTLPIDFNFAPELEPLNTLYDGHVAPMILPNPPASVVRTAYRTGRVHGSLPGEATATCTIRAGTHTCVVDREAPTGHAFGQAAISFLEIMIPPGNVPYADGDQIRVSLSFRP